MFAQLTCCRWSHGDSNPAIRLARAALFRLSYGPGVLGPGRAAGAGVGRVAQVFPASQPGGRLTRRGRPARAAAPPLFRNAHELSKRCTANTGIRRLRSRPSESGRAAAKPLRHQPFRLLTPGERHSLAIATHAVRSARPAVCHIISISFPCADSSNDRATAPGTTIPFPSRTDQADHPSRYFTAGFDPSRWGRIPSWWAFGTGSVRMTTGRSTRTQRFSPGRRLCRRRWVPGRNPSLERSVGGRPSRYGRAARGEWTQTKPDGHGGVVRKSRRSPIRRRIGRPDRSRGRLRAIRGGSPPPAATDPGEALPDATRARSTRRVQPVVAFDLDGSVGQDPHPCARC